MLHGPWRLELRHSQAHPDEAHGRWPRTRRSAPRQAERRSCPQLDHRRAVDDQVMRGTPGVEPLDRAVDRYRHSRRRGGRRPRRRTHVLRRQARQLHHGAYTAVEQLHHRQSQARRRRDDPDLAMPWEFPARLTAAIISDDEHRPWTAELSMTTAKPRRHGDTAPPGQRRGRPACSPGSAMIAALILRRGCAGRAGKCRTDAPFKHFASREALLTANAAVKPAELSARLATAMVGQAPGGEDRDGRWPTSPSPWSSRR